MQIVLDTNVLVSGLLSATGPPGRIVEAALAGHLQLVFDMAIRREYEDVLRRPELALPAGRVDDLFATIDEFGRRVAAVPSWSTGLPDPNDGMFLAVAAATANVLVTGNTRAACETPGAFGLAQSSILLVNTHSPWIADWMPALEDRRHAERWK